MKTRITILTSIFIVTVMSVYGQADEPLALAKKIFDTKDLPNIGEYITGEYKGRPNGLDLPKGSTTKFTLLERTGESAVVAMTILDSLGDGVDTYLYFQKKAVWKMSAFRALAMTGIFEQVKSELEKMTPRQVDEIIARSKMGNEPGFQLASKDDYHFQLGNINLILELDDNIIRHFVRNKNEFERLKNLATDQLKLETTRKGGKIKLIENLQFDYRKLFVSSVSAGDHKLGNCINFVIGGIGDNSVGYIYVKDKKNLPEMNSESVIMIREIGKGWYLYKTT